MGIEEERKTGEMLRLISPENELSCMLGKTFTVIKKESDIIQFITAKGDSYTLYHTQDCCESVHVDDVNGDLNDLIGRPLLVAEKRISYDHGNRDDFESVTWTFYTFRTLAGSVDIRWVGESNGYYSEDVDFKETSPEGENHD